MAVPGTILGVGFIRGFVKGLFHTGWMQGLYGTIWIIIIVFIVRSLPIGTRSATASLRQIDKSIEESAFDMGANSFKVFTSVTLPLVRDSFFASIVTSFVRSVTAISAVILLVTPEHKLITYVINEFAGKAAYPTASAYSTILMLVSGTTIIAMRILLLALIYIAFISLGLPDGLLGAAWPSMYQTLSVPLSFAGYVTMVIAGGTIISSLSCHFQSQVDP